METEEEFPSMFSVCFTIVFCLIVTTGSQAICDFIFPIQLTAGCSLLSLFSWDRDQSINGWRFWACLSCLIDEQTRRRRQLPWQAFKSCSLYIGITAKRAWNGIVSRAIYSQGTISMNHQATRIAEQNWLFDQLWEDFVLNKLLYIWRQLQCLFWRRVEASIGVTTVFRFGYVLWVL